METIRASRPAATNATPFPGASRRRLICVAMSALLIWHVLAIVIAPAPASHLTDGARKFLSPYLTLFGLDHGWSFFAPNVDDGYGALRRKPHELFQRNP